MFAIRRGQVRFQVRFILVLHVLENKCLSLVLKLLEEGLVFCVQEFGQLSVDHLTHERRATILNKRSHICLKTLAQIFQL
jgi:hypothetical protein